MDIVFGSLYEFKEKKIASFKHALRISVDVVFMQNITYSTSNNHVSWISFEEPIKKVPQRKRHYLKMPASILRRQPKSISSSKTSLA
jgi:hypothetical protein